MNDNTRMFIAALRSGHYKQAQEVLIKTGGTGADGKYYDEATAYCCLGLGSLLAGCEFDPNPEHQGFLFTRPNRNDEVWYDTLPGQELFDWLGIDVRQNNNVGEEDGHRLWSDEGRDIHLDVRFPTITVHTHDGKFESSNMDITLANLNDWGCTFDQIADMIERFGFKGADVLVSA